MEEGRVLSTEVTSTDDRREEDISLNLWLDTTRLSHSGERKETYVVRMPRDQVYRVPPPEHARIVEGYRNIPRKGKSHRISCCCWVLVAMILLGCAIGIFIGVSHLLFRPKPLAFHVASIVAKNLETNKQRIPPPFDVVVKVSNPNSRVRASYENDGDSSLIFKKVKIGEGEFKQVSQGIMLKFDGTKAAFSKAINEDLNDHTTKKSMTLMIDVTITMKNWIVSMKKDARVTCDFDVKSFGKKYAEILSQKCQTQFV